MKKFYIAEVKVNEVENAYREYVFMSKENRDKFAAEMKNRGYKVVNRTASVKDENKIANYEFEAFKTSNDPFVENNFSELVENA